MRIGELARQAGVSTSKIRFYEARALLPPATRLANGYRDYGEQVLEVVRFVDRARCLGFSLRQIADHLRAPPGAGRKARLQAQLEARLAELDALGAAVAARRAVISGLIEEVRGAGTAGSPPEERSRPTPGARVEEDRAAGAAKEPRPSPSPPARRTRAPP